MAVYEDIKRGLKQSIEYEKRAYKMKSIYAIVISPPESGEKYYNVYVPDLDLYTEGKDIKDAIYMAKDCIGIWGIVQEDAHKEIPKGTTLRPAAGGNDIVTLVEVDFSVYREIPNAVTIAAMEEAEEMRKNPEAYKRYKSVKELMAALEEDDELEVKSTVYPAIFHKAEEGGYWVEFPDLEGCVTEGDTLEEAFNMAGDALFFWLDAADRLPEPSDIMAIKTEGKDFTILVKATPYDNGDKAKGKAAE